MEIYELLLSKKLEAIEVNKDTLFKAIIQTRLFGKLSNKIKFIYKKKDIKSEIRIKIVVNSKDPVDYAPTIVIMKGARGVKSVLKIEVLNLAKNPHVLISPNMEILDNDIEASHSLTIRQLDQNEIKYLMSRGLTLKQTEKLLIQAFINDL